MILLLLLRLGSGMQAAARPLRALRPSLSFALVSSSRLPGKESNFSRCLGILGTIGSRLVPPAPRYPRVKRNHTHQPEWRVPSHH